MIQYQLGNNMSLDAIWTKSDGSKQEVRIWGFSVASIGDGPGFRPVAVVSECHNGAMRYVELKFLEMSQ